MIDKNRIDGDLDTSAISTIKDSADKIDTWADENNVETKERADNGIQIAQILDSIETPLQESQDNKSEGIDTFTDNAQEVMNEQVEKQDEISDTSKEFVDDITGKGETEAENINKMQSAVVAFETGGYDISVLQNYQEKTEGNINQLNDYGNQINDTNEKMLESNKQACDALSSAIENIKI